MGLLATGETNRPSGGDSPTLAPHSGQNLAVEENSLLHLAQRPASLVLAKLRAVAMLVLAAWTLHVGASLPTRTQLHMPKVLLTPLSVTVHW